MKKWFVLAVLVMLTVHVNAYPIPKVYLTDSVSFNAPGFREWVVHAPLGKDMVTTDCNLANAIYGFVLLNITSVVNGTFEAVAFENESTVINSDPGVYKENPQIHTIDNISEYSYSLYDGFGNPTPRARDLYTYPAATGNPDYFKLAIYFFGNTTSTLEFSVLEELQYMQVGCGSQVIPFSLSSVISVPLIAEIYRKTKARSL